MNRSNDVLLFLESVYAKFILKYIENHASSPFHLRLPRIYRTSFLKQGTGYVRGSVRRSPHNTEESSQCLRRLSVAVKGARYDEISIDRLMAGF